MALFKQFNLKTELVEVLAELGYINLAPVQEKVIPIALRGESLLARSETGSGKTHAFLVPILNKLNVDINEVQAIILAPTRELAKQIYDFATEINQKLGNFRILLLAGGIEKTRNIAQMSLGPQLIIATPGRLKDVGFVNSVITLRTVKTLVLDEADMLMDSGFLPIVNEILLQLDSPQIMIFSATIPKTLNSIIERYVGSSHIIEMSDIYQTSERVKHHLIDVHHQNRFEIVRDFIKWRNPYLLLIFCSEVEEVDNLYKYLVNSGIKCGILHGNLTPRERKQMLRRIRNDEFRIIVASDIAARGIDIPNISDVLNVNFPRDHAFYFHRAGRTGRFDQEGDCFSFYDHDSLKTVEKLESLGVSFNVLRFSKGTFIETEIDKPKTRIKTDSQKELDNKIQRTIARTRSNVVKPGYKKKVKQAVDKVKRRHRREMIKKDIQRQRREKYKKGS